MGKPDRPKALYQDLSWPEARVAASDHRIVLLPVGAIEQHGPHLPVDVDNRIVAWLCDEAAERMPELVLSAPPIHYGFNEHNMGFPGTISVAVDNFLGYVGDVVESFVRQGHDRVLLVNGHGSNSMLCALVARQAVNRTEDALIAAVDHWSLARDVAAEIRETPRGGMAHACEYETSWYLHLNPHLVRMDLACADLIRPQSRFVWVDLLEGGGPVALTDDWTRVSNGSGVEGDPATATATKGRRYAEAELAELLAFCGEFRAMSVAPRRDYTARGADANPWHSNED